LHTVTDGKRVVVLSDNHLISRAIQLALNHSLELEVLSPGDGQLEGSDRSFQVPACDLIVVAVSSPDTEPVVALVRSSLVDRIGHVPLLIISDRPFDALPEAKLSHLRYPFDPTQLRERVHRILLDAEDQGTPASRGAAALPRERTMCS
jgi:hypothetical protein